MTSKKGIKINSIKPPQIRQRKYKPRKYVTTWIRLEFDKNSKPVCAGQVLSELLWIGEQIKKEKKRLP